MRGKPTEPLVLTFIVNHFGRQGGCVAVVSADCLERGMPLEVNIVSTMEVGPELWLTQCGPVFSNAISLSELPPSSFRSVLANGDVQRCYAVAFSI